jgi:hypothetical protein
MQPAAALPNSVDFVFSEKSIRIVSSESNVLENFVKTRSSIKATSILRSLQLELLGDLEWHLGWYILKVNKLITAISVTNPV